MWKERKETRRAPALSTDLWGFEKYYLIIHTMFPKLKNFKINLEFKTRKMFF